MFYFQKLSYISSIDSFYRLKKKIFERKILSEISRNMSESIFAEVFSPNLYPPKLLGINVDTKFSPKPNSIIL